MNRFEKLFSKTLHPDLYKNIDEKLKSIYNSYNNSKQIFKDSYIIMREKNWQMKYTYLKDMSYRLLSYNIKARHLLYLYGIKILWNELPSLLSIDASIPEDLLKAKFNKLAIGYFHPRIKLEIKENDTEYAVKLLELVQAFLSENIVQDNLKRCKFEKQDGNLMYRFTLNNNYENNFFSTICWDRITKIPLTVSDDIIYVALKSLDGCYITKSTKDLIESLMDN